MTEPTREFQVDFCSGKYYENDESPEDSYFVNVCSCGCGVQYRDGIGRFPFTVEPDYNKQFQDHYTQVCIDCGKRHMCANRCTHCQRSLCNQDLIVHKVSHQYLGKCKSLGELFPKK